MNPFLDSVVAVVLVGALLVLFALWTRFAVRRSGGIDGPRHPRTEPLVRQRPREASKMGVHGGRRTS
ncbi:hypothetical protein QDR37_09930 [Amnibacterium sp. CER49]|uniref:hypothetical protein n=1 Tax=Amnibacterium sp. CER49 TaxID=3039161 RepID=UPI002448AD14|nr:hypothetical protein [Amnibacterium sp. CER49]MDH2444263.1 hypothetical protein [Amnibacterium sp. CER49]